MRQIRVFSSDKTKDLVRGMYDRFRAIEGNAKKNPSRIIAIEQYQPEKHPSQGDDLEQITPFVTPPTAKGTPHGCNVSGLTVAQCRTLAVGVQDG